MSKRKNLYVTLVIASISILGAGMTDHGFQVEAAKTTAPQITFIHDPVPYYVPGYRIYIEAKITDPTGIKTARCYFRDKRAKDFMFIDMPSEIGFYECYLPAPATDTEQIVYLLLAVNTKGEIVKTEEFQVSRNDSEEIPNWQSIYKENNVHVFTELGVAPASVAGFTDSIMIETITADQRYGTMSGGIYGVSKEATTKAPVRTARAINSKKDSSEDSKETENTGFASTTETEKESPTDSYEEIKPRLTEPEPPAEQEYRKRERSSGVWSSPWTYFLGMAAIGGGGYAIYNANQKEDPVNHAVLNLWVTPNPVTAKQYSGGAWWWDYTIYIHETGGVKVEIDNFTIKHLYYGRETHYVTHDASFFANWFDDCGTGLRFIPPETVVCGTINDFDFNAPIDIVFQINGHDESGKQISGSVVIQCIQGGAQPAASQQNTSISIAPALK